jgi:hypothetical protein
VPLAAFSRWSACSSLISEVGFPQNVGSVGKVIKIRSLWLRLSKMPQQRPPSRLQMSRWRSLRRPHESTDGEPSVGGAKVVFLILVAVACYFFRRQSVHPADNVEHSSVTARQGDPNLCADGTPHNFTAEKAQDNGQRFMIYCSKCGALKTA